MIVPADTLRQIQARAQNRCEYCLMHQSLQGATFHIEHIVPRSRTGSSDIANLAWCCPSCNLHKSDRTEAADPLTGLTVGLFHPRQDNWADHFEWKGYEVAGKTPVGRATVHTLNMNHPRRILIRKAEQTFELFPP